MKFFLFSLILFFSSALLAQRAEVAKWSVHEILLNSGLPYSNPYLQAEVKAIFKGPNGVEKVVNGFWDGNTSFKIRFTPTLEGQWTYTTTSKDAKLNGIKGAILCTAPQEGHHGFLRVDVAYPHHFVYDDGTRYFMFGTTYYEILANAQSGDRWKEAINGSAGKKMNKVRMNVSQGSNTTKGSAYTDSSPYGMTKDELNLSHWRKLDEVVKYLGSKGLIADLILFWNRDEVYGSQEQDERYLRYILARYGAYPNVIWCLTNEWEYTSKPKAYWNILGNIMYKEDPYQKEGKYRRLLSIHQRTRIDWQYGDADWTSHVIVQYGVRNPMASPEGTPQLSHGDAWGNASILYNLKYNMPVVNDEFGYAGEPKDDSEKKQKQDTSKVEDAGTEQVTNLPVFTRKKHRQVIWGIYTAGGYGSTGDKYDHRDGRPYFGANWHAIEEYEDIKHLVNFFTQQGIEYWKMSPNNDLVKSGDRTYVLAQPEKQYIVYSATGGTFSVDIARGNYAAHRYNPRTGKQVKLPDVKGGNIQSFTLPDNEDWVVYLIANK